MSNQPLERDQDTIQAMPDPELLKWRELASVQMELHPEDSELLRLFVRSTHEIGQRTAGWKPCVSGWLA
jgi:hypothetical protein